MKKNNKNYLKTSKKKYKYDWLKIGTQYIIQMHRARNLGTVK